MKNILAIFISAAALCSLASCVKEELNNDFTCTERIISGAFTDDAAKTTLGTDNKTPLWSEGDVIRVLDNTSYQDITLAAGNITDGGKKITFTTTLTGTQLYAVYPASATTMTKCNDGNITFIVPSIQDGTFGSANICVASGDGASSIYFSNATAVVEMSVASSVVGTKFTATNNVAGGMAVTMGSKGEITGTATTSLSSSSISVSDTKAPTGSKFYLAVAPVDAGTVTVTCNTTTKIGSIDKGTKALARDKIYAMNISTMTIDTDFDLTGQHGVLNGQEYVLIKAKYDDINDSYLKWATQNLAVTASGKAKWNGTDYVIGDYFQWAAYDGYVSGTKPENLVIYTSFTTKYIGGSSNSFIGWKDSKMFDNASAPYYSGSAYTKYTSTDGKTILEQSDDVANIVLGSTWRTPRRGKADQFAMMRAATYWAWDEADKGYYVFKPGVGTSGTAGNRGTYGTGDDKTKALLFFPAAGYGEDTKLKSVGAVGNYWSSTLFSEDTDRAYYLYINNSAVNPQIDCSRHFSFLVRPVSD